MALTAPAEVGALVFNDKTNIGITSGTANVTGSYHVLEAQTGITDDLDTLNGGVTGQIVVLTADTLDTIHIRHAVGNINIANESNVSLTSDEHLVLIFDGGHWHDMSGSHDFSDYHADGRLSMTSNNPYYYGNSSGATLYYVEHIGNKITVFDDDDRPYEMTFTDYLSLSAAGWTNGKNYDIFVYDNAGTLTLSSAIWTDDTTRATAISRVDGMLVQTADHTKKYLGTVRTSGTSQVSDTDHKRFVWNYYNRLPKAFVGTMPAGTWSYTTGAWRPYPNNSSTNGLFEFVVGYDATFVYCYFNVGWWSTSGVMRFGVGYDSTSTPDTEGPVARGAFATSNSSECTWAVSYEKWANYGYHYIQPLEYGDTGINFIGYAAAAYQASYGGWLLC